MVRPEGEIRVIRANIGGQVRFIAYKEPTAKKSNWFLRRFCCFL